jgi:hypothetical protein
MLILYMEKSNKYFEDISKDCSHWHGFGPPLSPNKEEVALFEKETSGCGTVCMLGMTKQLAHLCNFAIDLNPIDIGKPTICCNWFEINDIYADVFIGDGVVNLTEFAILDVLKGRCKKFACRVFQTKFDGMKYSTFFPKEFPMNPSVIYSQEGVAFVVWNL